MRAWMLSFTKTKSTPRHISNFGHMENKMQITKQMSQLSVPALPRHFAPEDVKIIASPAATACNRKIVNVHGRNSSGSHFPPWATCTSSRAAVAGAGGNFQTQIELAQPLNRQTPNCFRFVAAVGVLGKKTWFSTWFPMVPNMVNGFVKHKVSFEKTRLR